MEPVKKGQILYCDNCGVELQVINDCDSSCLCNITCCGRQMKLKEKQNEEDS